MPLRSYLMAIAIFANEVKGKSMLALSRDLGTQYKTAFVLAHKIREAVNRRGTGTPIGIQSGPLFAHRGKPWVRQHLNCGS